MTNDTPPQKITAITYARLNVGKFVSLKRALAAGATGALIHDNGVSNLLNRLFVSIACDMLSITTFVCGHEPCLISGLLRWNVSLRRPPSIHISTKLSVIWILQYDDVIKWKPFPRYWPFVRGIHRSPVNSSHKGQWRGALMFSLICVWMNSWVNNREAGDLRRCRAHYDVTVFLCFIVAILRLFVDQYDNFSHVALLAPEVIRDHLVYEPSQWETTLYCNVFSDWLGAYTIWSLGNHKILK